MKYKKIMIALTAAAALTAAGCGKSASTDTEVTPTPVPTAVPTAAPATTSPLPTSTPALKLIGVKTSTAKFVYITNSTKGEIREIYLRAAGGEEWEKISFLQNQPSRMQSRYRCIIHRILQQMQSMI